MQNGEARIRIAFATIGRGSCVLERGESGGQGRLEPPPIAYAKVCQLFNSHSCGQSTRMLCRKWQQIDLYSDEEASLTLMLRSLKFVNSKLCYHSLRQSQHACSSESLPFLRATNFQSAVRRLTTSEPELRRGVV